MDIGLKAGGVTLQQSFEIDTLCCETMRRNFSHEIVQCDITKKLVQSEKECHVMVATYPCTKYSPIADIHGVRTGDDLFLHFFRHVAIRKPETSAAKITRMATDTDKLLSHIRALSEEEKIRLLDAILTDLDTPDPEIDEIWANEARKRWEGYKAGRLETVSYEDLINRYKS